MSRTQLELNYLRAAAQNASSAGLVIILFDLLIRDIQLAIAAIEAGEVEKRSEQIKHAFLVLQQLEGSLNMETGGDAAKHFSRFYSFIRRRTLEAQIKSSTEILREQISLLLDVRNAWQQVDTPNLGAGTVNVPAKPQPTADRAMATTVSGISTRISSNWTA